VVEHAEAFPGTTVSQSLLPVLRFKSLQRTDVIHGITTRTADLPLHGNMSYMVGGDPEQVRTNRRAWADAIGYHADRLVLGRQVHQTTVVAVGESDAGSGADSVETAVRRVDGLMTSTPGLPIGVMAADCVPILIHDRQRQVIAAVHAGWRGTVDGIAHQAIEALGAHYGTSAADVSICLGPAICHDCYQVGDEVVERWTSSPFANGTRALSLTDDGFHFDLREANRQQFVHAGVLNDSIEISPVCTRCANGSMFSYRGLGPRTGLFTAVIMIPDGRDQFLGEKT
jgi:polyphenol oxidase